MKPLATLVLLTFLVLPSVSRATVIYQGSFEDRTLTGFTVTTDLTDAPPVSNAHASAFVSSPPNGDYDFGFTNYDGQAYIVINLGGPNSGGGQNVQTDAPEAITFTNSNVGATFQAFTTYTLTYLAAEGNGGAVVTNSFEANGVDVGTTSIGTGGLNKAFASGASLTFDTGDLANIGVVGQNIGFDSTVSADIQYDIFTGLDDFVITATPDITIPTTPEPSTYALMIGGFVLLAGWKMRRA